MKSYLMSAPALAFLGLALAIGSPAMAAGSGMPGDTGKPGQDGIMPANAPPQSTAPIARSTVPAPPMDLALKVAKAVAAGCKQYPLGVAVVNAVGQPILVYIPDGSDPHHAYTAIRKAYSAITFKANTSAMVTKAQQDPAVAAQIKADPNLVGYSGGILLRAHGQIIGALGVSGSEPGHHDEECGRIGLATVKDQLQ